MIPYDPYDAHIIRDIRAHALAQPLAHDATRCWFCWTPLERHETTPPGLPTIEVTRCPVCDTYRLVDDR